MAETKNRYEVTDGTILHDGHRYEVGDAIDLTDEEAERLNVEPVKEKTGGSTVKDMAELIEDCKTVAEVEELIEDDGRKGVIEAAKKRIAAIEEASGE